MESKRIADEAIVTTEVLEVATVSGPAFEAEPFFLSVRFWVSMLAPIIALIMASLISAVPGLAALSPEEVTVFVAGTIVNALAYVISRTWRNHDPRDPGKIVKEPFYRSSRFWVTVLTPFAAAFIAAGSEHIPSLAQLNPAEMAAVMASIIVSGAGYTLARGYRAEEVTPPVISS